MIVGVISTFCFFCLRQQIRDNRRRERAMEPPHRRRQRQLEHVGGRATLATSASAYPSGAWRGYYTHVDGQHGVCEFQLRYGANGQVSGEGTDDVGRYAISGLASEDGRIAFSKTYTRGTRSVGGVVKSENYGHTVEYRGRRDRGGVRGQWEICHQKGTYNGVFHLWPAIVPAAASGSGGGGDGEEVDEDAECCVCFDRRIDCKLEPCGHVALCGECAARLRPQRCPLCRMDIQSIRGWIG